MRVRLLVAYDGAPFLGWQETGGGPSVQGAIRLRAEQILQAPVRVEGASRTDRGVHAEGQLVLVESDHTPPDPTRFLWSLRRLLLPEIAILAFQEPGASWHPSLSSVGKLYRYRLALEPSPVGRHQCWTLPTYGFEPVRLDLPAMHHAATLLVGFRDFSAFATGHVEHPIDQPLCTLRALALEWVPPYHLHIWLLGDRFLYRMCRNIVGTLVEVGRHKRRAEAVAAALLAGRREGVGVCAPPEGLCLMRVLDDANEMRRVERSLPGLIAVAL